MADNAHRRAMVAWAEQLDRGDSPMGPLLAVEIRNRIARADEEDKTEFMKNLPNPDDSYHHWHIRSGLPVGMSPTCRVCANTSQEDPQ